MSYLLISLNRNFFLYTHTVTHIRILPLNRGLLVEINPFTKRLT